MLLAGEHAVRCMPTRIPLAVDLTFSTTRASNSTPRREGMQPKVLAVSVQTLEGGR